MLFNLNTARSQHCMKGLNHEASLFTGTHLIQHSLKYNRLFQEPLDQYWGLFVLIWMHFSCLFTVAAPEFFCGGIEEAKYNFEVAKIQKFAEKKWLILAIFSSDWGGGKWGTEPPTGGANDPMPPLMPPLFIYLFVPIYKPGETIQCAALFSHKAVNTALVVLVLPED